MKSESSRQLDILMGRIIAGNGKGPDFTNAKELINICMAEDSITKDYGNELFKLIETLESAPITVRTTSTCYPMDNDTKAMGSDMKLGSR